MPALELFLNFGVTRRIRRRRVGWVADFCPCCGKVQAFRFHRRVWMDHVLGVPVGLGRRRADAIQCDRCGVEVERERKAYEWIDPDWNTDLGELIRRTHPDVEIRYAPAIAEARALRAGRVEAGARREAILRILFLISPRLDDRVRQVRLDGWSAAALVATLFAITGAAMTQISGRNAWLRVTSATWIGVAALCGIVLLALLATDRFRYARRHVLPVLVMLLRPINPSVEELEGALARARRRGLAIGRIGRARWLFTRLKSGRAG